MIHRPTWLETAPQIQRLLPGAFDWPGWCEYITHYDVLPVDVYHSWYISTQPHLFDAAVEALYWPPAKPLCHFSEHTLAATECLGLVGYQRNYLVLWLCHRVNRYTIGGMDLPLMPTGEHVCDAPILPYEMEEAILKRVLLGFTDAGESLFEAICCYLQEPIGMTWSCVMPIGYVTGVKSDERSDGNAYEYSIATAQESARDELVRWVQKGVFTRRAKPFLRMSEVQVAKKTCIKLHVRFPHCNT